MKSQITIVGASIAGLLAASKIGDSGLEVTVYEEHREIGIPEKCDGLVSGKGMADLGLVPPSKVVQNQPSGAIFFSPGGREIRIDARKQNVLVLDRTRFDRYLAERALRSGARIELGKRVSKITQSDSSAITTVDGDDIDSEVVLDCSGYESYIRSGGQTLQGALYLVQGDWFDKSTVEVYLDPVSAPGFFFWVIPIESDIAKIGVAGTGINTFLALDKFVEKKNARPMRKMAAPVVCSGTLRDFVDGRLSRAGDAAGQAKPTTGGGIYTGGYGGMLAGTFAAKSVISKNLKALQEYEKEWKTKFGGEFRMQYRMRKAFEKMSADQLDKLFEMVAASEIPKIISEEGDFDRHSIAIAKSFGVSNSLSAFGMFISNEIKTILS